MFYSKTHEGYEIKIPESFNNYRIIEQIGSGSTSVVLLVENKETHKKYSAKIISKTNIYNIKLEETISKEINVLKSISHSNIIKIKENFEISQNDEKFIVIIMEYCEKGDLLTFLKNNGFKNDKIKKKIIVDFLKAIQYLHQNCISRGDIKAENILLNSKYQVKL